MTDYLSIICQGLATIQKKSSNTPSQQYLVQQLKYIDRGLWGLKDLHCAVQFQRRPPPPPPFKLVI